MKKLLSTLALAVAVSAGCGIGDIFNPTDGGTGVCPAGVQLFRIPTGSYTTMSAQVSMDTCQDGVMPADLMRNRTVENDTSTGNIIVKGATGAELGRGPVRCNTGMLTYGPMTIDDGFCRYTTTRASTITVTADATFTLNFRDDRSNTMNVNNCPQPMTCTVSWSATMKQ
jgi:hypothetical protein